LAGPVLLLLLLLYVVSGLLLRIMTKKLCE
jgi:hypothetical protein